MKMEMLTIMPHKHRYEEVPVDAITVGSRKRDPLDVSDLLSTIPTHGLLQPIVIGQDYTLQAGARRLKAHKILGIPTIPCMVTPFTGEDAEATELIENLQKADLTALERAEWAARLRTLLEASGEAKTLKETQALRAGHLNTTLGRGDDLRTRAEIVSAPYSRDVLMSITGKGHDSVQRALQIGTAIADEAKAIVRDTPIENNQNALLDIARAGGSDEQVKAAQAFVSGDRKSTATTRAQKRRDHKVSDVSDLACPPISRGRWIEFHNSNGDNRPHSVSIPFSFVDRRTPARLIREYLTDKEREEFIHFLQTEPNPAYPEFHHHN